MFEVILFRGEARTGGTNDFEYPANEKHGVLLFFRQPKDLPPNFDGAQRLLEKAGWQEVKLSQASPVAMEGATLSSVHPQAPSAYQKALIIGFSYLVFSEPILEDGSSLVSSRFKIGDGLVGENPPLQEAKDSAFADAATALAVYARFHELYLAMAGAAHAVKKVQKSVKDDKAMLSTDALELREKITGLQKRQELFFAELQKAGIVK